MPTKIFVGNVALNTPRETLMQLFQRYGSVTECDVLGSYAFVHMMNEDEASNAIRELSGCQLNGSRLNIELSTATTQGKRKIVPRFGSTKIFVGNIRDGTTSDQLRELFECYGKVAEADVLSGFGFVHMENDDDAMNAIRSLNGHILNGNRLNVEMSTSTTQGKARDRDSRLGRNSLGTIRYDPYTISSSSLQRRPDQQYTVDTTQYVAVPTYVADTSYVSPQPAAMYPRAVASDSFARDLLDLYSTNPAAFAAYARSPIVRQTLSLTGAVETVGILPTEDIYGRSMTRADFYEKNVGTRLADLSIAAQSVSALPGTATALGSASAIDPYAAMAALRGDPTSAVSRGFSAVRVAAPPPGCTYGAPTTMHGAQLLAPGTVTHMYAPYQ